MVPLITYAEGRQACRKRSAGRAIDTPAKIYRGGNFQIKCSFFCKVSLQMPRNVLKLTRSQSINADYTKDEPDAHIWDRWIHVLFKGKACHFILSSYETEVNVVVSVSVCDIPLWTASQSEETWWHPSLGNHSPSASSYQHGLLRKTAHSGNISN